MYTFQSINELVEHLETRATAMHEEAKEYKTPELKAMTTGYAYAYQQCALWLRQTRETELK